MLTWIFCTKKKVNIKITKLLTEITSHIEDDKKTNCIQYWFVIIFTFCHYIYLLDKTLTISKHLSYLVQGPSIWLNVELPQFVGWLYRSGHGPDIIFWLFKATKQKDHLQQRDASSSMMISIEMKKKNSNSWPNIFISQSTLFPSFNKINYAL